MSDPDQKLQIVTEHVDHLAVKQHTAADAITTANRLTEGVSERITSTHGSACSATSSAMSAAEEARLAAGAALRQTSLDLADKLTGAAINYNDVDYRSGKSLGQACQA